MDCMLELGARIHRRKGLGSVSDRPILCALNAWRPGQRSGNAMNATE